MFIRENFDFTESWFIHNVEYWEPILKHLKNQKIKVLEIGAFEGESTTWMLEELLTHPESKIVSIDTFDGGRILEDFDTIQLNEYKKNNKQITKDEFATELEQRFYKNVSKTGKLNQVEVMKSDSHTALISLNYHKNTDPFDFIYIDASHFAYDVILDTILAWRLLKTGGIMIFDDYEWDYYKEDYNNPKVAVNAFLACYKPEIEIIHKGYQVAIKKINQNNLFEPKYPPEVVQEAAKLGMEAVVKRFNNPQQ